MLSCNDLNLFAQIIENYKEQTFKIYTLSFRDKLSTKVKNAIRMAKSITSDNNNQIFKDEFLTKNEYNFLYLIAIEQQNRSVIEIISDLMS